MYENKLNLQTNSLFNFKLKGDSGGPLIEMTDGRAYQMGVASFIPTSMVRHALGLRCNLFEPVVYTKVSFYINWIDGVINGTNN